VGEDALTGPAAHLTVFDSPAQRETVVREYGALDGARETLDRLEEHLKLRA